MVTEEPGVGLGAGCAGAAHDDPGAQAGDGPPRRSGCASARAPVPMWVLPSSDDDDLLARAVVRR